MQLMKIMDKLPLIGIGAKFLPVCNEALSIFNGMFSGTMDVSTGFTKLTEMVTNLANDLLNSLPQIAEIGSQIITNFVNNINISLLHLLVLLFFLYSLF